LEFIAANMNQRGR